ncbi:Ribosome-binding factor A [compost metagenome]
MDVSRDVGHAKVFITVMGQETAEDIKQSIKVLNSAAGFLRMQLGKEMKLRSVPQLHFHYDESVTRGAHLSALIERAVAEDSQHQDADSKPDAEV